MYPLGSTCLHCSEGFDSYTLSGDGGERERKSRVTVTPSRLRKQIKPLSLMPMEEGRPKWLYSDFNSGRRSRYARIRCSHRKDRCETGRYIGRCKNVVDGRCGTGMSCNDSSDVS